MKKWIRLMTVCTLVLTLFLFTGCEQIENLFGEKPTETTPEATTPEATTPEATTPEDVTDPGDVTPPAPADPDQPAGSVLVDSIGGKSAAEAMQAFAENFASAESFDWSVLMESVEDGEVISQYVSVKLYNGEVAASIQMQGTVMEVYYVDGVLYINQDGQKMKLPLENPEDFLGEGWLDGLVNTLPDFSEDAEMELEDVKIYLLDGIYYFTVHEVDEETGEEATVCYQFNEAGELMKAEGTSESKRMILTMNSYGKPVEITPPANEDAYSPMGNAAIPEGAVAVDTVNGMNATQLFEKFVADYSASKAFDIKVSIQQTVEGETMTMSMAVMLNEDAVYYGMAMDGEIVKVWVIDGICYVNTGDQKIKQEGLTVDEIIGEGSLQNTISSLVSEIPEGYYDQLAEAQLYYYEGVYFYTVVMVQPGMGIVTEIVMFDAEGNVVRVSDRSNGMSVDTTVNAYGNKTVTITPPADADQYIDAPETETPETPDASELPQTEDEIYAFYTDACTTLQSATHYVLSLFIDGEQMADYNIAGSDKYITVVSNGTAISQWLIDNVGYASTNYQDPTQTEITDTFLETFARFEAMFPIDVLAKAELQNLRCSYNADYDEIVVEFEYTDEEGYLAQYTYAIPRSGGYADITITEMVNGTEDSSYNFFFVIVPDLEITLP